MVDISIVDGGYKLTYNWGYHIVGSLPSEPLRNGGSFFDVPWAGQVSPPVTWAPNVLKMDLLVGDFHDVYPNGLI